MKTEDILGWRKCLFYTNTLFGTKSFQIDFLLGMERVLLLVEFSSIGIESIKADPMTEIFFGIVINYMKVTCWLFSELPRRMIFLNIYLPSSKKEIFDPDNWHFCSCELRKTFLLKFLHSRGWYVYFFIQSRKLMPRRYYISLTMLMRIMICVNYLSTAYWQRCM